MQRTMTKVIIHPIRSETKSMPIHIGIAESIRLFIPFLGMSRRKQLIKPVSNYLIKRSRAIRIAFDIRYQIRSYHIQAAPLFIIPHILSIVINEHWMRRFQISYYDTITVHHFNSSQTIAASLLPRHTRAPIAIIIAHGHIVKRMNRKTESTIENSSIRTHRLTSTELFELFIRHEMQNTVQLSQRLHRLTTMRQTIIANLDILTGILIQKQNLNIDEIAQCADFTIRQAVQTTKTATHFVDIANEPINIPTGIIIVPQLIVRLMNGNILTENQLVTKKLAQLLLLCISPLSKQRMDGRKIVVTIALARLVFVNRKITTIGINELIIFFIQQ